MYKARNKVPINRFPLWKYLLIVLIAVVSIIYALPNIFGDTPSLQLSPKNGEAISQTTLTDIKSDLDTAHIAYNEFTSEQYMAQMRFSSVTDQMKAQTLLDDKFGKEMTVALMLATNTPEWLQILGAAPMNLGLDLRGGMYFVLEADLNMAIKSNIDNYAQELRTQLREKGLRYSGIVAKGNQVIVDFSNASDATIDEAKDYMKSDYPALSLTTSSNNSKSFVLGLSQQATEEIKNNAVSQVIQVMRNRVNELGVAEASVARAGSNRVVIELPGLQDAARAKQILGGTATVRFQLVDNKADAQSALSGNVPIGSGLYYMSDGQPVVLYNRVILSGNSVVDAKVGYDSQTSLPAVQVKLSGPEVSYFSKVTGQNVGKPMATVLVQTTFDKQMINGKEVTVPTVSSRVISVATINSQLGNNFQITGLNQREAQNLSLLIRSGALPTPVQIVQEQQIGPTMGAENIRMGAISIVIALVLVILFMGLYYRLFGLIANVALILNLFMIVGIMSIMPGATLTLPGIAGIVLNLGMAIDANVLIFERIREELRNGMPPQAAIHAGYERAFGTIVDSNLTTLIVAVILFAIGTGAVKGFAVTLMIGIVTSMYTSVTVSRGMTNLLYGKRRNLQKLSIGI
jgi:preprotein translocase subunit SecD